MILREALLTVASKKVVAFFEKAYENSYGLKIWSIHFEVEECGQSVDLLKYFKI